jgi:hypothetical protein
VGVNAALTTLRATPCLTLTTDLTMQVLRSGAAGMLLSLGGPPVSR